MTQKTPAVQISVSSRRPSREQPEHDVHVATSLARMKHTDSLTPHIEADPGVISFMSTSWTNHGEAIPGLLSIVSRYSVEQLERDSAGGPLCKVSEGQQTSLCAGKDKRFQWENFRQCAFTLCGLHRICPIYPSLCPMIVVAAIIEIL